MNQYQFKKEMYKSLLDGRSVEWLSQKLEYSASNLYLIFNQHRTIRKPLAIAIVKTMNGCNEIEYFFEKQV